MRTLAQRLSEPHVKYRTDLLSIASNDELINAVAKRLAEHLLSAQSPERWVTANEYCKRWKVSRRHLHRHKVYFENNGAIDGTGKIVRYDKFFSPKTGRWIYS